MNILDPDAFTRGSKVPRRSPAISNFNSDVEVRRAMARDEQTRNDVRENDSAMNLLDSGGTSR